MLKVTNEVKRASYEFTANDNLKVIGSIEKNDKEELIRLDGSVNKADTYIGNIYVNSMDGKLKVNINNVEVENLGDVDYLAQELLREFESAE